MRYYCTELLIFKCYGVQRSMISKHWHLMVGCCSTWGDFGDWQKLPKGRGRNVAQLLSLIKSIPVTKRSVLSDSKDNMRGHR